MSLCSRDHLFYTIRCLKGVLQFFYYVPNSNLQAIEFLLYLQLPVMHNIGTCAMKKPFLASYTLVSQQEEKISNISTSLVLDTLLYCSYQDS